MDPVVAQLRNMTFDLDLNLPEITSMANKDRRQKKPTYLARVKIGDQTWTSHPATFYSANEAENAAVQRAIEELTAKRDLLKAASSTISLRDEEKQKLIENITKIIAEEGGAKLMLHNAVSEEYVRQHKTPLPKNWIDLISDCDGQLVVERQQLNKGITLIGLPKNSAINISAFKKLVKSEPVSASEVFRAPKVIQQQEKVTKNAPRTDNKQANTISKPLRDKSTSGDIDVLKAGKAIPPAEVPAAVPNPKRNEDYFDVHVIYAATPANFYVQSYASILPDSPFSKMSREMQDFYNTDENKIELNADLLTTGIYAAVKYSNNWSRVRIESVMNDKNSAHMQLMCLFVDYGELHVVEVCDVQPLYSQFRSLPRQAVKASLAKIEPANGDWDVLATYEYSKMVEGKSFVGTVTAVDWSTDHHGEQVPAIKVSMCDTSQDMDVYIEQVLVKKGFAKLSAK
ncbi:Tudor domain-containing protein 5 [Halotydeus destructor]|nr:Tudor domain-containing protein 5 [Halotydeus destructor]